MDSTKNGNARTGASETTNDPDHPESASADGLIQLFSRFAQEALSGSASLVEIYADRLRASFRRTVLRMALGAAVALFAAFWLAASALAMLRGICAGTAALFQGPEWLGELAGGALALAFAIGAAAVGLVVSSRRELRRLEKKYERIRNDRSQDRSIAPSGEIGGGTARPRRSGSQAEDQRSRPAAR